jgi:hypothetical protein
MSAYLSVCPPACLSVCDDDCTVNNRAHLLILQIHDCGIAGAMTTRPRFMRPCKSSSLDYRSLLDTSRVVKNENGLCVPVLIGPYKWGLNKHGQLVPMVNTLKYVER